MSTPFSNFFTNFFAIFCPERELHSSTSKALMSIPSRKFFHKSFCCKSASQGRLSVFPRCFALSSSKLFSVPRRETACIYYHPVQQKSTPFLNFFRFSFLSVYATITGRSRRLFMCICACSSVDRASASGAGCVGSIPIRRAITKGHPYTGCPFCYVCLIHSCQPVR